jgi:hypothetical protein
MRNTKTDDKNIQLLKLIAQLRDHIDLHRIIGLNATELRDRDISGAFPWVPSEISPGISRHLHLQDF